MRPATRTACCGANEKRSANASRRPRNENGQAVGTIRRRWERTMKKLTQRWMLLLGLALVGACAGKRLNEVGELAGAGGGADGGVASGGSVGSVAGTSARPGGTTSMPEGGADTD